MSRPVILTAIIFAFVAGAACAAVVPMAGFGDSLPNSDGLVAEYQMFGNADDSTDNGFHGSFSNGATAANRWISIPSDTSVVSVADADALTPSNAISLSVWFNATENGDCTIVGKEGSATDRAYYLRGMGTGSQYPMHFVVSCDGTNFDDVITATNAYATGVWTHVVCTFSSGTLPKIYINGVDKNATRSAGGLQNCIHNNAAPLTFGRKRSGGYPLGYVGLIGPVRLYNRELSADEIMDIFAGGPPSE